MKFALNKTILFLEPYKVTVSAVRKAVDNGYIIFIHFNDRHYIKCIAFMLKLKRLLSNDMQSYVCIHCTPELIKTFQKRIIKALNKPINGFAPIESRKLPQYPVKST